MIQHVGRSSGRAYRTPLEALPVADGFLFMLVYGSRSDWVQNVLAAGGATLVVHGRSVQLSDPEVIDADAVLVRLPTGTKRPPRLLKINEFLSMSTEGAAAGR